MYVCLLKFFLLLLPQPLGTITSSVHGSVFLRPDSPHLMLLALQLYTLFLSVMIYISVELSYLRDFANFIDIRL